MRSFFASTFAIFAFIFCALPVASGLTLFVQTPTAAGAPALVVWTRDPTIDGILTQLRFDLRFVLLANTTTTPNATSSLPLSESAAPTPAAVSDSDSNPSFVVQPRADLNPSDVAQDAGLALANIRLGAGTAAGSADVFFPAGGRYVVKAVSGPNNTLLSTSNTVIVTESAAAPASAAPTTATSIAIPSSSSTPDTTTPQSTADSATHRSNHPNVPAIIGGVLGVLVLLALIGLLAFLLARRRAVKQRRMTFHREWMVQGQSAESVGEGVVVVQRRGSVSRADISTPGDGNLVVPPSPFISVTPPPPDLEAGLVNADPKRLSQTGHKALRLHTHPHTYTYTNARVDPREANMPLPAGAAPPTMYTPSMLAGAGAAMRQIGGRSTPVSMLTRLSTMPHPIGQPPSPVGPRAPASPSFSSTATSSKTGIADANPFADRHEPRHVARETDAQRFPASAPALTHTFFPVRSASAPNKTGVAGNVTRVDTPSIARAATTNAQAQANAAGIINTRATRPVLTSGTPTAVSVVSSSLTTTTVAAMAQPSTARQRLLAARLAVLDSQIAESLSAPDSVHAALALADMRRQAAWIAEHLCGEWALGRTEERPAGWARVMTP